MKLIEPKICEVFVRPTGKIHKCCERKGNDWLLVCHHCCFFHDPECLRYTCTSIARNDGKGVYFIKATQAELEEYEQIEEARNRG